MTNPSIISALARSMLAGEATVEQIEARAGRTLGRQWGWLRPLARRYVKVFGGKVRPRQREVVAFLLGDDAVIKVLKTEALKTDPGRLRVADWLPEPQQMLPVAAARGWGVPALDSVGGLADWLGLSAGELEWFADLKGLGAARIDARLSHYNYRVLSKQFGSIRLIEAPKSRLKELQGKILREIADVIPAHPAAHGFLKGRSITTFAAPHVGKRVVLRMDLQDFFPSISGPRVQALFRTAGYPELVADLLGGIATNAAARNLWSEIGAGIDAKHLGEARELYSRPHLPQGAPTSPALANLCTYRVDSRLSGLAEAAGAVYTRYADDLAFSGDGEFEAGVERFSIHAAAILMEEGFTVHHRKTRIMRRGVRQYLAGLVTNDHTNVVRTDFDRLKAALTNCVRYGAESQNREGHASFRRHLEGRVGFVAMVNPARGLRLRRIFEKIEW